MLGLYFYFEIIIIYFKSVKSVTCWNWVSEPPLSGVDGCFSDMDVMKTVKKCYNLSVFVPAFHVKANVDVCPWNLN